MKWVRGLIFQVFIGLFLIALLAGCGSKPAADQPVSPTQPDQAEAGGDAPVGAAAPVTATPVPPTPSATPSPTLVPPTHVPTATHAPGPLDYMLNGQDVPDSVAPVFVKEEINNRNGSYSAWISFQSSTDQDLKLNNVLTINPEPVPGFGEYSDAGAKPLDAPQVGQGTRAFEMNGDPLDLRLEFFKDRAYVTLNGYGFDLDTLVSLAEVVAARIPENIPGSPAIAFPETLDQALFDQYFNSLIVGRSNDQGEIEPASIITDWQVCWSADIVGEVPPLDIAIYDPQTGVYIQKSSHTYNLPAGFDPAGCGSIDAEPGQYELRFAVDNTLVASIPFEIAKK